MVKNRCFGEKNAFGDKKMLKSHFFDRQRLDSLLISPHLPNINRCGESGDVPTRDIFGDILGSYHSQSHLKLSLGC